MASNKPALWNYNALAKRNHATRKHQQSLNQTCSYKPSSKKKGGFTVGVSSRGGETWGDLAGGVGGSHCRAPWAVAGRVRTTGWNIAVDVPLEGDDGGVFTGMNMGDVVAVTEAFDLLSAPHVQRTWLGLWWVGTGSEWVAEGMLGGSSKLTSFLGGEVRRAPPTAGVVRSRWWRGTGSTGLLLILGVGTRPSEELDGSELSSVTTLFTCVELLSDCELDLDVPPVVELENKILLHL